MENKILFNGQSHQDKFVLNVLNHKTNGFFVEIGSNHPIKINNTYILEKMYAWIGIMIEYSDEWLNEYITNRPNSAHIIKDATQIDYKNLFEINNCPNNIDYLQIDLEPTNGSTLATLEKLDNEVMDIYKFAVVTFEHDIYRTNTYNTREKSRIIFKKRGYIPVFEDVNNEGKYVYEDWYIHPDLVNMDYIKNLKNKNYKNYKPIQNLGKYEYDNRPFIHSSIDWKDIDYA